MILPKIPSIRVLGKTLARMGGIGTARIKTSVNKYLHRRREGSKRGRNQGNTPTKDKSITGMRRDRLPLTYQGNRSGKMRDKQLNKKWETKTMTSKEKIKAISIRCSEETI